MYVFDTDILSSVVKKRRPDALMQKLALTPRAAQFTTAINAAEIYFGILRIEERKGMSKRLRELLLHYFETKVFSRLNILPFDKESAAIYGRLKAGLERQGRPRFEPDIQIAAIAIQHNLTIVTGNVRHFSGIAELKVENWLEG